MVGSRTAQLEEKLEDLVTLLRNQATTPATADDAAPNSGLGIATPSPSSHSTAYSQTVDSPEAVVATSTPENSSAVTYPSTQLSLDAASAVTERGSAAAMLYRMFDHKPGPDPSSIPSCPYFPTPQEAEENLIIFRTNMLYFYPFMYIPPHKTAGELREEMPFLWFSINTVACKSVSQQQAMSASIRKHLAEKIIIECEKSMDLLLGLLVYIGWSHHHKKDKPYLVTVVSLLTSLVYDLNLNKQHLETTPMLCFRAFPNDPWKIPALKTKTLEERRAILACFYISSVLVLSLCRVSMAAC